MDYPTKLKLHKRIMIIWATILAIWAVILAILFAIQITKQERPQIQNLMPQNDFVLQDESNYLIQDNAFIWTGGNYIKTEVRGIITGYSSDPAETDDTPYETASGTTVNPKTIACPRDISFGTIVIVDGQEYICEDRMALKHDGKYDLWFSTKEEAENWGKQEKDITILQ